MHVSDLNNADTSTITFL